jgi:RNA polymerase sigma-70 factor, ECF subfamily
MPANNHFAEKVAEEFSHGQAHYGDINLSPDAFQTHVWAIVCKHLGTPPRETAIPAFVDKLYFRDLYLACGCVQRSENAWKALDSFYRRFVTDLVRFCYRKGTDAEEVADAVLVSLYLPDRSGRHRIASYDGRSSLATWLRVIVVNRAINERHTTTTANAEIVPDMPDRFALLSMELILRAGRYKHVLADSITSACQELTARDRLLLLWRYEENLQLGEIARLLGIHQSNVTRQLVRLQARLRENVIAILSSKYRMSSSAIQECLADIVENPQHTLSIVNLIKNTPKPSVATESDQTAKIRRLS